MARDLAHAEGVELADAVNDLFEWLSARDLYEPTVEDLENATGYERADVIALYGASILAGADVFVSTGASPPPTSSSGAPPTAATT